MAQEERERERETTDKNISYYCIPNLQKLVQQAPQCGWVLASNNDYTNDFHCVKLNKKKYVVIIDARGVFIRNGCG